MSALLQTPSILLLLELHFHLVLLVGFVLLVALFVLSVTCSCLPGCLRVLACGGQSSTLTFPQELSACFMGPETGTEAHTDCIFRLLVCMTFDKSLSVFVPPFPYLVMVARTLKELISNYMQDLVGWILVWSLVE